MMSNSESGNLNIIIGLLSLLVIILFVALTVATMKLKDSEIFSNGNNEDEMEEWVDEIKTQVDNESSD